MIHNIKSLLSRLSKNELIRVGSSTSAANVLKMGVGIVVQKYIAVQLGPAGVAMIAQFQNYISITTSLATGGIGQGIVKYIAEFKENESERTKYISNAVYISLICSLCVALIQFLFLERIGQNLFTTNKYNNVLWVFGGTIFLFALNNVFISLLNGFGQIKEYVVSNIARSIIHLCLTIGLIYWLGLEGALWSLSVIQSLVCLITFYFIYRSNWYSIQVFLKGWEWDKIRKLLAFAFITFSTMVFSPYTDIEIRNLIIENLGIDQAGLYDALVRLSRTYFSIITMSLSVYYVPKLSRLQTGKEIRSELVSTLKVIVPLLISILLTIYFLSDFIFVLLYSERFIAVKEILPLFLLGDFFRCCAMIMGYLFIAKAKTLMFIIVSLLSLLVKYYAVYIAIPLIGLQAASLGHLSSLVFRFISYVIVTYKLKILR